MPPPLDRELFQIKGRVCAVFCCLPAPSTVLIVAGICFLLAKWWLNVPSASLSSHSPWLSHHIHTLSQITQASLSPMLVFSPFLFVPFPHTDLISLPNNSGHAGALPWTPPSPHTHIIFLSANQSLFFLQGDPLLRNTIAPSYTSSYILYLPGIYTWLNIALEKLFLWLRPFLYDLWIQSS